MKNTSIRHFLLWLVKPRRKLNDNQFYKSKKGFAPIIIILAVVILLGIGAGGFVLVSKDKTPSSPLSSSQTETDGAVSEQPAPKAVPVQLVPERTPLKPVEQQPQQLTPPLSPPVSGDNERPKIVSINIELTKSPEGNNMVTIHCRATDDVALREVFGVFIGLMWPGQNPPSGMVFWQQANTQDANPKDQTWSDTFGESKLITPGTYSAVCDAVDKTMKGSERVFKTFSVP